MIDARFAQEDLRFNARPALPSAASSGNIASAQIREKKMASSGNVVALRSDVSEAEWETRVGLAAAFRIAHHLGWNDTIRNHITARIPDAPETFLMNPAGLGWHEITASSLLRVDLDGNILTESDLKPGPAGLNFHTALLNLELDVERVASDFDLDRRSVRLYLQALEDLELIEIKGVTYILGANNKSTMDLIRVNPSGLPAS